MDHALDDDAQVWQAAAGECPHQLLLTLYDHLLRHPWAPQVIGLRAPRGPAYLRFSERLRPSRRAVGFVEQSVEDPLTVAYAMFNLVLGSAATVASAADEPVSPVGRSLAPTYARLHAEQAVGPRTIVDAGLLALRSMTA